MEDRWLDISEKMGNVNGRLTALESRSARMENKIDTLHDKIDANTKLTASMRSTVAGLASGISVVFTVAVTWVWNLIVGNK